MLRRLIALTEETIGADFDRLLLEEKQAERIIAVPTDPEKILSGAGSVECYSACLAHDLERGNSTDAPLGMIIPAEHAGKGEFRPCFFFTRAEAGDAGTCGKFPPDAMRPFPQGRGIQPSRRFRAHGQGCCRLGAAHARRRLRL